MKYLRSRMFLLLPFVAMLHTANTYAQEQPTINKPFDSLIVINPQATGDKKSGKLIIRMDIENRFPSKVRAHLRLGNFEDLGIRDMEGRKYKIHTMETAPGNPEVNEGFMQIDSVAFGGSTYKDFVIIDREINPGDKMAFVTVIRSYPTDEQVIPSMQFTCVLIRKGLYMKTGHVELKDIPIRWE